MTDKTDAIETSAEPSPHLRRLLFLLALLALALAFAWFWYFTPTGADWRARKVIAHWMGEHRVLAPLGLIVIYIALASLAMPVWWLQMLAGRTLGLTEGIIVCQAAATLSAGLTAWLARWTAGDFLAASVESRMQTLRKLEERLGHNGLLVVMATRLVHVVPFGLSNYLFGLLHIRVREVMIGTLLGNLPAVCWLVGLGWFLGAGVHVSFTTEHLREHAAFFGALVAMNVLLLALMAARYLRPQWFRKIGLE